MEEPVSLAQAKFWTALYLEMLAAHQQAIRRMRRLASAHDGPTGDYRPDIDLIQTEITRVFQRLRHWEEMVDTLEGDRL